MSLNGTSTMLTMNPLETSLRRMQGFEVTSAPAPEPIPNYKPDLFAYKGNTQTPWISEHTQSFSNPKEYTARVLHGSLVHTGGCTGMAFTTHHTDERPKFPPGTIRSGTFLQPQYVPTADPAMDELHAVAHAIAPRLPDLLHACASYHLHTPDGWITTGGFMTASKKAGLTLSRGEYLALERALTKDTFGRINYHQLEALVSSVVGADMQGQ